MQVLLRQVHPLLQVDSPRSLSKQMICQTVAMMIHGLLSSSNGVTSQSSLPRLKYVDMGSHSRSGKPCGPRLRHETLDPVRDNLVIGPSQRSTYRTTL